MAHAKKTNTFSEGKKGKYGLITHILLATRERKSGLEWLLRKRRFSILKRKKGLSSKNWSLWALFYDMGGEGGDLALRGEKSVFRIIYSGPHSAARRGDETSRTSKKRGEKKKRLARRGKVNRRHNWQRNGGKGGAA